MPPPAATQAAARLWTALQDKRTYQPIVQNCRPHIDTETLKVAFNSGVGILICPHMRIVCIIDTVAIELPFVCKHDVTMQLSTAIEPLGKVEPLSKIARSEMLHSLHVVWIHALCMQCSPHSRVGNTKMSCNSSRTRTWIAVYHTNNAFFIGAFINTILGYNTNARKSTGIPQCLVNSSKHSSVWYSTIRNPSLLFCYGKNWVTVTKPVHINHIFILFKWKCKWRRERNRRTEMRIRTGGTGTLHCRFYRSSLYETRHTVLNIGSRHSL